MFAPLSDAGVLVPPPSSSLGYEATLSVAMELERRFSVKLPEPEDNPKRSDGSPTELPRSSPALPTGGNAKNHNEEVCTTDESLHESDHSSSNREEDPNSTIAEFDDEDDDDNPESLSNTLPFTWDGPITKDEPRRSGKTKNYRCKQCNFVATTKTDFWAHNKTHIKAEKLLTCPKCPFVTEYKHHLEYHIRNHYGSKPFKCDQCTYSCVNRSMLNSHMKSHSNVYQFQCADCSYATKYCHSLKLHLRKYQHRAANPANDVAINTDVNGNRKPKKKQSNNGNGSSSNSNGSDAEMLPMPPLPPPQGFPFFFPMNGFHFGNDAPTECQPFKCNLCEFCTPAQELLGKHMLVHAANDNKDLCSLYGINSEALIDKKNNGTEYTVNAGVRFVENQRPGFYGPTGPLDLSNGNGKSRQEESGGSPVRNRRKGKAYKLDRILRVKQEAPEVEEEEEAASSSPSPPQHPPLLVGANGKSNGKEERANGKEEHSNGKIGNECPYCEIIFKDNVMYSIHMGYHGFHNPFQCNICGQLSDDKVSFFLHIAKTPHL